MAILITSYILLTFSGLIWGVREYYHKSSNVFERLYGCPATGFWGSLSWQRKYKDYPVDTRPKNKIIGEFPYNDFWHLSWYISKGLLIAGSALAVYKVDAGPTWLEVAIDVLAVFAVTAFWAGFSFAYMQKKVLKKGYR